MPNEPFEKFLSLVTTWESSYLHATISYCGIENAEGVHLLFGKVRLELAGPSHNEVPYNFNTKQLVAARFGMPISKQQLREIFENAKNGKLQGTNGALSLLPDSNDFHPYWANRERPFPGTLIVRGASVHNSPIGRWRDEELTWELNSAAQPIESLDELLNSLGLPNLKFGSENTRLEIEALSPGEIEHTSTICDGKATVSMRVSAELDLTALRLGFRYSHEDGRPAAGSFSGKQISWNEQGHLKVGKHSIPVGKAPMLRAYLSYNGIPLDRRVVDDPKHQLNSRRAIHLAADPDMEALEQLLLSPARKDAEEFENAVAVLLTLLGFSTIHYGLMRDFKESPDAIAVATSGNVAVVECTTGYIDIKDKLTKLVGRASRIRACLRDAGHGNCEVLSVVVSPLPRDEVNVNIKTAEEMRIAVICKEQLENLLGKVRELPDSDKTFEHFKKLIPLNPGDVMGGLLRG